MPIVHLPLWPRLAKLRWLVLVELCAGIAFLATVIVAMDTRAGRLLDGRLFVLGSLWCYGWALAWAVVAGSLDLRPSQFRRAVERRGPFGFVRSVAACTAFLNFIGWATDPLCHALEDRYWNWFDAGFDRIYSAAIVGPLAPILVIVVVAPVVEECVYRGVLLDSWSVSRAGWVAEVQTALVFGLMHGWGAPFAIVAGYMWARLRRCTGSLHAGIAAHAIFNVIGPMQVHATMPVLNACVALLCLVASLPDVVRLTTTGEGHLPVPARWKVGLPPLPGQGE